MLADAGRAVATVRLRLTVRARKPALIKVTIREERDVSMNLLWGLAVLFFVMWLFGFGAFHIGGGFIHLLLVLAVAVVLINIISGRRAV
jgi:hypothetical protein